MTARMCLVALVLSGTAPAYGADSPNLAGRPLAEAISMLQAQGLRVVFTEALVLPEMRVAENPPATKSARERLEAILAPHGLALAKGAKGAFLVVKASRLSDPETEPSESPAATPTPEARYRENVVVKSKAETEPDTSSRVEVSPGDVMGVAGGAENVFRVLQTLPGVVAADGLGSRLSVRGGGPDENLTVVDGVEIHNPYRLFTLMTAFNPETIESFDFRPGGFSVRYGDRLSSLLTVATRAGTRDETFDGSIAASLLDVNAVAEGRLPGRKGSWLVSARRTYYDLIAEQILDDEQALPSFNDLQAKVAWDVRPGHTLSLFALRGRESTAYHSDYGAPRTSDYTNLDTAAHNNLLALTHRMLLGPRWSSRTTVSGSDERTTLGLDAQGFTDGGLRSVNTVPDRHVTFSQVHSVRDSAVRHETSGELSRRHLLAAGFDVHRLETRLRWTISGDRESHHGHGSLARLDNWELPGSALPDELDSERALFRGGAWVESRLQLGRLELQPGLRVDRSGNATDTPLSPRLAAVLRLTSQARVRVAAGLYTQSPGYEKFAQADDALDLSRRSRPAMKHERVSQALVGFEQDVSAEALLMRVEVYHKRFDRVLIGRLETEEERAARVARYDFPFELRASIPSLPEITVHPVSEGRGYTYGFDVYLERRPTAAEPWTGWFSYSYGVAMQQAYGRTFPADYERRHAAGAVLLMPLGRHFWFNLTGRVASGFPYTRIRGIALVAARRDDGDVDGDGNRDELVPYRDGLGSPYYMAPPATPWTMNSGRLGAFARFDLRLTWSPRAGQGPVTLYLDIINVLNRRSEGRPEATLRPQASGTPIVTEARGDLWGIPILPTLGLRVRF